MKKMIIVLVGVLVLGAFGAFGYLLVDRFGKPEEEVKQEPPVVEMTPQPTVDPVESLTGIGELQEDWEHTYRVMAHALGGIDGKDYTNSLEAFILNYNQGTRLFEIDLDRTSDGDICLIHTWDDFRNKLTDVKGDWPMSTEEFKNTKIYGKYTPMLLDDLLNIMMEVPDFHIIIDSKTFDMEKTRSMYDQMVSDIEKKDPELLKRFIPQAYTPEMYDALDQEYDFDKIIFTLYHYYVESDGHKIYNFVKDRKVPVVVMHMNDDWGIRVITDIYEYARMDRHQDDFTIYIHTINDMKRAMEIINDYHFFGVYSDFITEQQLQQQFQ